MVHNFWRKALMALSISLIHFCPLESFAQESFITVGFSDNLVVCGPGQTATVTFSATGDTLTNIKGVISAMNPFGIAYEPSSFSSADGVTLMGNMLIFPDLLLGASATFQIDFVALCGAANLTGSNFLEFDFTYRIDGVTEEMVTVNSDDPGFSVTKPGLSFILPSTDMFQPVIGEPDTIVKKIVNGGDGDIDSALYFVLSHPDLILSEIYVEGQDETFVTTGLSYSLDFAGASGDTLFYWIGADALQTTGGLDAVWNGIAGMGSSFQESFVIREIWMGSSCAETPPDIGRGLGYGCTIGNPLDLCTSVDNNSIVVFDRIPDLVSGQFNWGTARPACYADVNTQVGYYITNDGDAPAEDVIVDLSTSGVGEILEFRYSVGSGGNGMYTAGDLSNNSMGCAGINSLIDTLKGIDLAVGDTIYLQAEMIFDCSCDPSSCGYAQIYRSNLDVEVIDRCGDVYPGESAFWSEGVVSIGGFAEGPFEVRNGESGCITYTLTGYRNDWFNGNYPLSYYEMDFAFPAGLEMDNTSVSWNDSDGTSYAPNQVSFVDGDNMNGDTIKVRWSQAGQPVDWVPSAGSQIEICYTVDCTNPCGGPIDITPSANMDFVIDPTCTSCTQRPVFCPLDLPMRLICNTIGVCMCDGLAVYNLDINRVNYGLGDNDNDKCPEAMESLDLGQVETKRYLQGDTLKANIKALVSGSAVMGQSWTNSTFHLLTESNSIAPVGGEFRFYDANTSTTHTCDVLDITVNTSPMGDTISVDLSIAQLNTFCPSISSMLAYEDGDSLELCLFFAVKDEYVGLQKPVLYGTEWSIDDGVNDGQSCIQQVERLTQIGIDDSYMVDLNNDFGGCEDSNGSVRESRFFGAQTFDEFPFEVRELGLPQDFIYVKPSAFSFKLDQFGFLFQGALTGTLVDHPGGDASLAAFIQISGDSLIFKAGDYLRSLGSDKIPSDEGYNASFYPRIQGDCRSVPGIVQNAASLSSSVVDIIFCTPLIQRDAVTQNLEYTGGPQLTVTPDAMSIVVNQPNQCLSFTLTNSTLISAPHSFIHISNPTGNVVVNSLVETTGGMNTPVMGTSLGIYELGFTANSPDRTFEACVTVNTCGTEALSFVAGWDCNQYPTTVLEATCADPSVVTFTTGQSGLGLLVTKPAADEILELCEEVEYELILNSSMNGSLRDLVLNFDLPIGQEFVPNSLTYQWPQAPPSGYLPGMDPTNIFGNSYELDVSALDAILEADGLPGVDFIPNNAVRIRFRTTTNCDYISGSKAAFFASARNACGDAVPGRFFPSKKVNINSLIPTYSIDVEAEELFLNPCNEDMTIIEVDLKVGSSTGNSTLPGDSVRIILPPGITYSSMSYMPGSNASATGPQIKDLGGQQQLDWMIPTGLSNNAEIDFSFGVTSTDVGQQCRDYKMLVQTYSTVGADCISSGPCEIGVETGSAYISFTIIKPNLVPRLVSGMLFQLPPDEVIFMYTIEVQNNSTIGLPSGTVIPLKLYEDVDNSGTPTSADILLDVDVLTIDSIAPGRSFELTSTDTFPSGSICAVIAVLDPDTACVCAIEPTNILKPQLKFSFEKEIEVCSGVDTVVGPVPISGYDYTWLPVDGSYLGALDDPDTTQTTFQYINTSGAPIIYKYALRAVSSSCYEYDTLTVTVYPVNADSVVEPACMGEPILLAGPVEGSNFNWLPVTGLDDPTKNFPVLMNPTVNTRYTVTYDDDGGCPAFLIVDIVVQNCVAGTALGDTVWFDINKNGIYDDGELPIPGVVVLLFPANNPTGPHIRVDTTDANGMYLFDNLSLGQYIVKFIAPDGFLFTLPNVGLDNLDSDADPNTGLTGSYSLNNGDYDATVDAGLISACDLTVDLDVGDCRVSGDTLLRTVTATINWTDAAYTYDYLFGEDTLLVSYLGMIDTLVIDSLDGEVMITFQTNQSAPFTLIAGFTLDSLCADTVTTSMLVPCVFDLALTKIVDESFTTFPVLDNDTVKYKIKVYNQGSVNAENIVIKDHIPCGFSIIAGLGDLATADSTMYLPGPLLPGSADSVCVYLRFQQPLDLPSSCRGNDIYTNYTEIFSVEDPYGDNPKDQDSEPNSNSMEELAVTPGSPGDDDISSVGINDVGSEDDHDPAYLEIFDLALKKQVDPSASGPYFAVGDTVKYLLTVYNQGNVIAESLTVIDTIFDGLEFINTSLNSGWTDIGGNVVQFDTSFTAAMAMGLDTFVLGDSVNFCLSLRVKSSTDPGAYLNMAQISSAIDTNGVARNEDNDSPYDAGFLDNAGGAPGSAADDFIGGIGTGTSGGTNARGDDDSHDPALFLTPVSIGDTTFVDVNVNGIQDAGDVGLPGVTVTLFMIDPMTGTGIPVTMSAFGTPYSNTAITDGMGAYLFDSLPHGQYYVEYDVSTTDEGLMYVQTQENAAGGSLADNDSDADAFGRSDTTVFLYSNEMDLTLDAGWFFPVTIGDTVFVDMNYDGLQDSGDLPLEGVTVTLIDASTGAMVTMDAYGNMISGTTITDMDGAYLFDSLPPGNYYVAFDVASVPGAPLLAPTIENVNGGSLDPLDSDVNSQGYSDTANVSMSGDTNRTLDAGFYYPVVLGDTVFVDVNNDGYQNMGDLPLEGVTVTLIDAVTGAIVMTDAFGNSITGMTTTDMTGAYLFDSLPPGTYYVEFDVNSVPGMPLLAPTFENINGGSLDPFDSDVNQLGYSDTVALTMSGDTNRTLDAGYYYPVVLGDTVFVDVNYNGLQDMGDLALAGVTVTLRDAITGNIITTDAFGNTISGMTITDVTGLYLFDSLPLGTYFVEFDVSTVPGSPILTPTFENVGGGSLQDNDSDVNGLGYSDTVSLNMIGDTNRTLDAGYAFPVVLGDTVFVDVNYDGLQNSGDLPLEGIVVTLRDAITGNIVTADVYGNTITGMTITDMTGAYLFDSLPPGTYYVEFDVTSVPGMPVLATTLENVNGGSLDPLDSDVNALGYSDTVTLIMIGDTNLTLDAGFYYPVVIGDTVFVDVNYDGLQNMGDLPLAGVTVTLIDAVTGAIVMTDAFGNSITGMTTTDMTGAYLFDSLPPGTYYVEFDVTSVPGMPVLATTLENVNGGSLDPLDSDVNAQGYSDTADVTMSGDTNRTLDAGFYYPVVLGDTVFVDINNDGLQNMGDLPLEGVTVTLRDAISGNVVMTDAFGNTISGLTTTDITGAYLFDSLPPGTYYVEFDVSSVPDMPLLAPTFENINGGSLDPIDSDVNQLGYSDTVALTMSGDTNRTLDAGYYYPVVLGDTVFVDVNYNGLQDMGDYPLANVTVTLRDAISGDTVTMDAFGNTITGMTLTDADGLYLFDSLPLGSYFVEFDISSVAGSPILSPTLENIGGASLQDNDSDVNGLGYSDTVTFTMIGDTNRTLDAGYLFPVLLGDTVFVDANYNGLQDVGEAPIEGVTVTLINAMNGDTVMLDAFGNIISGMTQTDADGHYLFDSLPPGDYYVVFDVSTVAGMPLLAPTLENVSMMSLDPDDSDVNLMNFSDTAYLTFSAGSNLTLDAGYFMPVVIGDTTFVDVNRDGQQGPEDLPMPGITVTLYDAITGMPATINAFGGPIVPTMSDANGAYLFDSLPPGVYYVVFDPGTIPGGYAPTLENVGDSIQDSDINDLGISDTASVLMSGDTNRTLDAGYYPMHSIGNQVWTDANNNGIFDSSTELPIENVEVILHYIDPVGGAMAIDTTLTNALGLYLFDSLIMGSYFVEISAENFAPSGPLEGAISSSGSGEINPGDGYYEPAPDPDVDMMDADDNGTLVSSGPFVGSVLSDTFLLNSFEPKMEVVNNDLSGALDSLSNLTVDFGFVVMHSIGNQVWSDANNNGMYDEMELALSDVKVILYYIDTSMVGNPAVKMDSALTDGSGLYLFDSLIVGDYFIEIPGDNFQVGGPLYNFASSTGGGAANTSTGIYEDPMSLIDPDVDMTNQDDNGVLNANSMLPGSVVSDTITLMTGGEPTLEVNDPGEIDNDLSGASDDNSNLTVDFGFTEIFSLGNQVWNDENNNGLFDSGEMGIAGVVVNLHYYDTTSLTYVSIATVTSGSDGLYLFDSLIAGDYFVELPASNFDAGGAFDSYVSSTGLGNVMSNGPYEMNGVAIDEDLTPMDGDDNGVLSTDVGFVGSIVSETVTLGGIEPVGEDPNNDLSGVADDHGNLQLDFGLVELHSIGNQVWVDINNDGMISMGEGGLDDVQVVLHFYDQMTMTLEPVDTTFTSAGGFYLFDSLITGSYIIEIPQQNGAGQPLEGHASSSGSGAQDLSHGIFEDVTNPVDADLDVNLDDNGILNLNSNFPTGSIASDTITLGQNEPENEGGSPFDMDNDLTDAADSTSNLTIDFGFVPLHSVGNQLWVDTNNNGLIDAGEGPLSGVTLILHFVDGMNTTAVDTVISDLSGLYLFDSLITGDYFIEIPTSNFEMGSTLDGYTSSTGAPAGMGPFEMAPDVEGDNTDGDDNGTTDGDPNFPGSIVSSVFTLDDDEPLAEMPDNDMSGAFDTLSDLTVDFGLFRPVSLGDTTWVDANENGILDDGELPLEGVIVTLYYWDYVTMMPVVATTDAYGDPIATVVTDANGYYTFDSLAPGNYLVAFDVTMANTGDMNAENWQITYQNQGGSDELDSDADEFTGLSDTTGFLTEGVHDPTLDAGFFAPRFDLALTKGLAPGQSVLAAPGDTVSMWILVANQGNVPSKKYTINDVLPSGIDFVDASPMQVSVMDSLVQWCDSLPDVVGFDSYSIDTFLIRGRINPIGPGLRDFQFRNWAEIAVDSAICYGIDEEDSNADDDTGYDNDDGPGLPPNDLFVDADLDDILLDSLPGDEDDSDFVDFFTRRFDLAIMKTLSPLETDDVVIPGDTVIFDIKVYNQGNTDGATGIPADNITIVDYVPENLVLVEENGWLLVNDTLASRTLEVGDELMIGGLEPDSCVVVSVRFVMNDIIIAETFNIAEIAHATDTADLEILDFDSELDSINQDVNIDDALDDNAFEDIDTDGDGTVDEDDSDFAKIITCVEINCHSNINLSLGPDCMLQVTPSMLLADTRISDVRPDFYEITLEVGNGLPISNNILDSRHVGKTIKASITWIGPSACPQGSCWSEVTVSGEKRPYIEETKSKTVYCVDPFLQLDPLSPEYPRPQAFLSCTDVNLDVQLVGDWIDIKDCELGVQDTAKIIYREWTATSPDGLQARAFDTIYVLRLPAMAMDNLYCATKDTLYCGTGNYGPYMILPDVCPEDGETDCDTIYLLDSLGKGQVFDSHCGFLVHVDKQEFGNDGCAEQSRYRVEIKQNCYGLGLSPGTCVLAESEIEINGMIGEPLYGICDFWLIDIDTLAPLIACKLDGYDPSSVLWATPDAGPTATHCYDTDGSPVLVVSTTTHDCSASVIVPPVCVYENWTGIKVVKATIEGVGSVILERTGDSCIIDGQVGYCYGSKTPLTLEKGEGPIEIVYEVYDSCHNVGNVSCYILIKDKVKPVPVADKGVTVSIGSKKDWVAAEVFEEGSWDNCGLNMVLARRSNWTEVCVDLCDSIVPCYISAHGDTLWQAVLETDKHIDEVEAHYATQLTWWKEDGADCGDLLWNAWQYDLMKHATLSCGKNAYLSETDFRHLVEEAISKDTTFPDKFVPVRGHGFGCATPTDIEDLSEIELSKTLDEWSQMGGGWSDQVPFDCMDACGSQIVEILVIDYWCNWGTVWTEVWVEDKTPVEIAQDVTDQVEISCGTYKAQGIDVLVALAEQGDVAAHAGLDSIFGGYTKAWEDAYGNYVDANGDPIPSGLILNDVQSCTCTTTIEQVREYDDHLGYQWVDREVSDCYNLLDTMHLQTGIVAINCGSNVVCAQEVWSEFDECGQGFLYRKWKITQSCPAVEGHTSTYVPDTVTRIQRIWIGNNCELSRYMFTMPMDTVVDACGITYAAEGSGLVEGAADPSLTGTPEYLFDDDCRIVGIGRHDKVFKIVGGDALSAEGLSEGMEACQKVIRTWYVADWCGGKPTSDYWWQDRSLVLDSFVQKIIIRDTVAPICIITGPVDDGGELEADGGCTYDLQVTVDAIDACGLMNYQYELQLVSEDGQEIVAQGDGELVDSSFEISETGLGDGNYILKVRVEDECTNESFCTYAFTVVAGKKPSPVCVTAVTAELTGMDLNGDGSQDTAMAVVWAKEFNSSSSAACGSETALLEYRLDLIDGLGDETFEDDTTYLEVGCAQVGVQTVRMWVIDPSGTFDYCDVQLTVQDNDSVCGSGGRVVTVSGLIETELADAISEVSIRVMDEKDRERMVVGDAAGAYDFAGLQGSVLKVIPEKDGDDVRGVSTADLILLQKHMLGKQRLESAYELESADVNADGRITALDLITMRRLILGSIDEYPASDSWRFYEEQSKSSTYRIDPLEASMELNWIGVKIGDLNHDYDPGRSMTRSSTSLLLEVPDVKMEEGRQYRVSFTAENFAELLGYQFTMEYDPDFMEIKSIDYGDTLGLTEGHFNLDKVEAGIVTTSWHLGETVADREKGLTVDPSEVLFSLLIQGKAGVHLSDVFTINSRQTTAEAYDNDLKVRSISLRYTRDRLAEEGFALYQNRPNPFRTETVIGFYLPEAMHARLTIYDAAGKLLKVIERDYSPGYQEEQLLEEDLQSHGVIYYQLDTKEFTATRTMVIMD